MVFWTLVVCIAVALVFCVALFYGAPFIPAPKRQVEAALDLLELKPGQTLLELGSGDGRVLRAAARRGVHAVGYELNPLLVWYSRLAGWKYRHLITIRRANYWQAGWPDFDAVYVFLMRPYMAKFETKVQGSIRKPVKVASLSFKLPNHQADKVKGELYLYSIRPAG